MMKTNIATTNIFKPHKSYTAEEVLAAGGTTAFSHKQKKNTDTLIKALQDAPAAEPFTQEEWDSFSKQMANDK